MPSLDDIQERDRRMRGLIQKLEREEDMQQYLLIVQQLEEEGKALQTELTVMAAEYQATKPSSGKIEVVLTPEQRARVLRETGVAMTTVMISDPTGVVNAAMPVTDPAVVEAEALRQAALSKVQKKANEEARIALERYFQELEAQPGLSPDDVRRVRNEVLSKMP